MEQTLSINRFPSFSYWCYTTSLLTRAKTFPVVTKSNNRIVDNCSMLNILVWYLSLAKHGLIRAYNHNSTCWVGKNDSN